MSAIAASAPSLLADTDRVVAEGTLEHRDKNLFTSHLGSDMRQFRLRIDGRWYFCCADDFADAKPLHIDELPLGAQVRFGAVRHHGRDQLVWLRSGPDHKLAARNVARRAAIFLISLVLTLAAFGLFFAAIAGAAGVGTGFLRGVVVVLSGLFGMIAFCTALVTHPFLRPGLSGARRRLYATWKNAERT